MSLLDDGPDEVLIYPETTTTDDRGNEVRGPSAVPVALRCRVQPVTSDEAAVAGQQVATTYRLITRSAPLGAWARVVWDGREWDVVGEPQKSNGSPRTRHITALLRARGAP
ncbi:Phage head-tail joining protein [Sinosporangium album]|uniref:Phage head-tail joining protein n=1 Tax=Sinosporangium album TaxID=504805 RepID=A0A1G8KC43_9ACTN|nr:head-tail adaptor protein [Sinosporangium album]SDI41056.1 Phage head-tail joining protein [Sinosporangium album]